MILFRKSKEIIKESRVPSSSSPPPPPRNSTPPPPEGVRSGSLANYISTLRHRTVSKDSLSTLLSSVSLRKDSNSQHHRKSSLNSLGAGSMTSLGGTTKLLRAHKMQTSQGDPVDLYFGFDALSVNGRSIPYGDIVLWSHTASHFNMTYLLKTTNKRRDVVLYPTLSGPKPSEVTEMLGVRISRLVVAETGCSEERAVHLATSRASEGELREATAVLNQHVQQELLSHHHQSSQQQPQAQQQQQLLQQPNALTRNLRSGSNKLGSGLIEVNTTTSRNLEEDA